MPMEASDDVTFGPFRLNAAQGTLWWEEEPVALRPRPFSVLCYLAERPGQLVTKEELLTTLWADTHVTKAVLKVCIRAIREALNDDAVAPRYVETVGREGYRFIGLAGVEQPGVGEACAARSPQVVGREVELDRLQYALEQALSGERQLVFVSGEAGIGKTTLVDLFTKRFCSTDEIWVGRGQCLEQHGAGEAYLPVLEAVGQIGIAARGEQFIAVLRRYAPTWLVQLPALAGELDFDDLQRKVADATRDRMLREMAEALESLTIRQPIVLVFEDLHWSDVSTLELLAYLAQRRERAWLLLIGTYRPTDVIVYGHPLRGVQQELSAKGHCQELALELLTQTEVTDYITQRFGDTELAAKLAPVVHQRTEGNALFVTHVLGLLEERGLISEHDGRWQLYESSAAIPDEVPESLRQLIAKQIEKLGVDEQRVLETASIVGAEFSVASVATGLKRDVEDIEEMCEDLAWQGYFLQESGIAEWPDGTVSGQYQFRHALYPSVLYERIAESRRLRLHRAVGKRLEAGYQSQASTIAAELAIHFEHGREYERAIHCRLQAAENALKREAHHEATSHFIKSIALLSTQPDTADRAEQELRIQRRLAASLMATKGFASQEVEQACARMRELCERLGETRQLASVLPILRGFHFARGEMQAARQLEEQYLTLAEETNHPLLTSTAYSGLGETLLSCGELEAARIHLERGLAGYDLQQASTSLSSFRSVPHTSVACLSNLAATLGYMGFADQSRKKIQEAEALSQELAHPPSQAYALDVASIVYMLRREPRLTQEKAEAVLSLAHEYGFPFWTARCTIMQGWAVAKQGQAEQGLALIHQGVAGYQELGMAVPPLGYLADVYGRVGLISDGLKTLDEIQAILEKNQEHCWKAELLRRRGELLLQRQKDNQNQAVVVEAESCFQTALTVARGQQAKLWELRATLSLSRLWQQQDKIIQARALLAELYGWFTEGFATRDLKEAKALLEQLS